jgi:hypothetical protein
MLIYIIKYIPLVGSRVPPNNLTTNNRVPETTMWDS